MGKFKENKEAQPKGKVSALKKLKASLKEAGVIGIGGKSRGSQSKKQRQSNNTIEAGKNKRNEKLAIIQDSFNQFEIKKTSLKYDILGRKLKGVVGKPTLSKQIGEDNRKQTLLKEYKTKNRTGAIIDRRFGENDATMTPEEKMLERFAKEKQKKARNASIFNLEDDDELELTHLGQSLSNMDDFNEYVPSDEEEGGGIDKETVHKEHFGGFDLNKPQEDDGRPKTKAEVMKELIAKSKYHKYERQKLKEDDDKMRQELDNELDDIKSLLFASKPTDEENKRKPLASQSSLFKKEAEIMEKNKANGIEEKPEDYDRFVRELAFEQKAHATDRTKTEEELAMEEKALLEKAERRRLRRMQGIDSESESDEATIRKKSKRTAQGDDLDDDFIEDRDIGNFGLGEGVKVRVIDPQNKKGDENLDAEDEENEDEEDDDGDEEDSDDEGSEGYDEDDDSEESGDEFDDEDDGSDLDMDINHDHDEDKPSKKKQLIKSTDVSNTITTASEELPYTFPLPQDHSSLLELVGSRPTKDHATFLQRAKVLYHHKLAPENKEKVEVFIYVLLEQLSYIGNNKKGLDKDLVNVYTKGVSDLALQIPDSVSRACIKFLRETHEQFKSELDESDHDEYLPVPNPGQLLVFSIYCRLFSVSDFHHAVISPMLLFLGQILLQTPLSSPKCLSRLLYIISIFYETVTLSKRYIPEVVDSMYTILVLILPKSVKEKVVKMNDIFYNRYQLEDNVLLNKLEKALNTAYIKTSLFDEDKEGLNIKLKFSDLLLEDEDPYFTSSDYLTKILVITLRSIRKFADLYGHHSGPMSALPQAFEPFIRIIGELEGSSKIHEAIKQLVITQKSYIQTLIKRNLSSRYPLQLQKHRAVAIKSLIPKFEADYSLDKHYDADDTNKEFNKLKRQHNRELKGAVRELRKDTQFLAREKLKEIKEKDAAYKKRIREITGELANVQGDEAKFNYERKYKRGK